VIRGAKKQVIEVLNTENEYFEKAILVVSDRYLETDRSRLDKKAKEYVSAINPFSSTDGVEKKVESQDNVKKLLTVLGYFASAALGATLVYFVVR
jgi:hypothetical protein